MNLDEIKALDASASSDGRSTFQATDVGDGSNGRWAAHLRTLFPQAESWLTDDGRTAEGASDVLWGSPYGATVRGYVALNAAHRSLMAAGAAPRVRYPAATADRLT